MAEPHPQAQHPLCWGSLPWPLLGHIFEQLSALLDAQGPLTVAQAAAAVAAAAPCRHWAESAAREVRRAGATSDCRFGISKLFSMLARSLSCQCCAHCSCG